MRTAFISGGTHGIGLACAIELATRGCNVAVCGRDKKKADKALADIKPWLRAGAQALYTETDVLYQSDVEDAIKKVLYHFKYIDVLINNVGGMGRAGEDFISTKEEIWRDCYFKNVWPAVMFTRLVLPGMMEKKWGRVIAISSLYAKDMQGKPWFTMAKVAEEALMKSLARDPAYVKQGITFNTVAPGFIDVGKPILDIDVKRIPAGYFGRPEDVAAAVGFLASDEAKYVNGARITVDGGASYAP